MHLPLVGNTYKIRDTIQGTSEPKHLQGSPIPTGVAKTKFQSNRHVDVLSYRREFLDDEDSSLRVDERCSGNRGDGGSGEGSSRGIGHVPLLHDLERSCKPVQPHAARCCCHPTTGPATTHTIDYKQYIFSSAFRYRTVPHFYSCLPRRLISECTFL